MIGKRKKQEKNETSYKGLNIRKCMMCNCNKVNKSIETKLKQEDCNFQHEMKGNETLIALANKSA